jgi:hypothetical protein
VANNQRPRSSPNGKIGAMWRVYGGAVAVMAGVTAFSGAPGSCNGGAEGA